MKLRAPTSPSGIAVGLWGGMSVVCGVLFGLLAIMLGASGHDSVLRGVFVDFLGQVMVGTFWGVVVSAPVAFVFWCFLAIAAKRREPPKWYERK